MPGFLTGLLLFLLPQEPLELHNTAWQPEVEGMEQQALQQIEADLRAGKFESAVVALDRLLENPPRRVVPCGSQLRLSLRRYATELLRNLPPEVLRAWDGQTRAGLERRLAAGGGHHQETLAAAAARYPAAAATPALLQRLFDLAVEAGDVVAAESWLREYADAGGADVAHREEILDQVRRLRRAGELWPCPGGGPGRVAPPGVAVEWAQDARTLPLDFPLPAGDGALRPVCATPLCGVPGVVVAGADRALVVGESVRMLDLVQLSGNKPPPTSLPPIVPLPCLAGTRLYTVLGPRPGPKSTASEVESHVLLGVDLNGPRLLFARRTGDFPLDGVALDEADRKALDGVLSFADGLLALDERLYVVVTRPLDNTKVQAFLACLDGRTGLPLWITFLCQGSPLSREPDWNRQESLAFPDTPPAPIAAARGLILVGTSLGILAAVDARSGELAWSWRYQRIPSGPKNPTGWPRAPVRVQGDTVFLAPSDASWFYQLRLVPSRFQSQAAAPLAKGELAAFLGVAGPRLLFLEGGADGQCLVARDRATGTLCHGVALLPGEYPVGDPLVLERDLWLASDRAVYRHDLTRDLFLAERYPCEGSQRGALLGTLAPRPGGFVIAGRTGVALTR